MNGLKWMALLGLGVYLGGAACRSKETAPGEASRENTADADVLDGGDVDEAGNRDATSDAGVPPGAFVSAPHPPWPVVSANAGVVLHPMKLVTVVSSGDPQAADLFDFGDALVASHWWQTIGADYGLGRPSGSVHVTGPAITANPDSATMAAYIHDAIAQTPTAASDGQTMYMLYLPPGVDIVDDQTQMPNTQCQYYGGYHLRYDESGDTWGVAQHCPQTLPNLSDLQWMTVAGSHEIAEAATDPIPGNGYSLVWNVDTAQPWTQSVYAAAVYGEVADLCAGTLVTEGSFTYQRIWSTTAAAKELDPCVPPYASVAYVNASTPDGWYTVAAGGSVQIPVTGFSDRATEDWVVTGQVWTSSDTGYIAFVSSPTVLSTDAGDYATTNNDQVSTLTITAPSAPAGSWATVGISSEPLADSGDPYHLWFVGVYIP